MQMTQRQNRLAVWIAALAMALNALWPLIAQAKPRSVTLVPVCTVQGVTHYIELPGGNSPLEQKSSAQHEHCSYCSFGGERAALPPLLQSLAAIELQEIPPAHVEDRRSRSEQTSFARPRAPPAIS
jgi:hypothetical protein